MKSSIKQFNSAPPGEILLELYLRPLGWDIQSLSMKIDISALELSNVIYCQTVLSEKLILALAEEFNTTSEFWINLQRNYNEANH